MAGRARMSARGVRLCAQGHRCGPSAAALVLSCYRVRALEDAVVCRFVLVYVVCPPGTIAYLKGKRKLVGFYKQKDSERFWNFFTFLQAERNPMSCGEHFDVPGKRGKLVYRKQ